MCRCVRDKQHFYLFRAVWIGSCVCTYIWTCFIPPYIFLQIPTEQNHPEGEGKKTAMCCLNQLVTVSFFSKSQKPDILPLPEMEPFYSITAIEPVYEMMCVLHSTIFHTDQEPMIKTTLRTVFTDWQISNFKSRVGSQASITGLWRFAVVVQELTTALSIENPEPRTYNASVKVYEFSLYL